MKITDVSDQDVKSAAQLINMLQAGELTLSGKELCAAADTIRWFQQVAVAMAEGYKQGKEPEGGLKIKSMGKK